MVDAHAVEQLGNVGSEVDRALELFDLSATDPRWTLPKRREILRARELFCRVLFDADAEADLAGYL
jgi:hypothetical protein